jgi:hypothetical protein
MLPFQYGVLTNTFYTEDTKLSTSGKLARIVPATRSIPMGNGYEMSHIWKYN